VKAVRIFGHGGPEVIQYGDYKAPEPGEDDILVRVIATSVSAWDVKYRRGDLETMGAKAGLPGRKAFPMPQQLGREAAGIVEAVGEKVTDYEIGDRVLGLVHPENPMCLEAMRGLSNLSHGVDFPGHVSYGGNAQFISRPQHHYMKLPDSVTFDQAAAGAWSFPTSHRIVMDRFGVRPGDTILVTGTSGGMGNATTQWAKLAGARVIGVTRKAERIPLIEAIGADLVIDTANLEEAKQKISDFTFGQGVDHAVEYTGNSDLQKLCIGAMRLGGNFCPVGGDMCFDPLPLRVIDFTRLELNVHGIRGSRLIDQHTYLQQLGLGRINVPVGLTLPLSKIHQAHEMVENSEVVGKIVLHPWADEDVAKERA
jgi:NADPH:quinone reductase-like Zn-dependent oxidoreductase